jgi:hypothetical protein
MYKPKLYATLGITRWCDVCHTVKPAGEGKLVPVDKIHGKWMCKQCIESKEKQNERPR